MIFRNPDGPPRLACDECGCHWFDRMGNRCYECGAEVSAAAKDEYLRALADYEASRAAIVDNPARGN